jgi:hypothetical protein
MRFSKGIISAVLALSMAALGSAVPAEAINTAKADASSKPIVVENTSNIPYEENQSTAQSIINSTQNTASSSNTNLSKSNTSKINTLASNTVSQTGTSSKVSTAKSTGTTAQTAPKAPAPLAVAAAPAPPSKPSANKLILGYGTP